jgi:undecaprenyl diphosphate synthase
MIDLRKLAEPGSIEETLVEKIDLRRLPRHVAVIMDGNGRWAKSRNLPRVEGHRSGIASVREIVETAARLELGVITLYAFSVENWKRPRYEVATLMMLLKEYLRKELATLMENNIRFTPIGRIEGLDPSVQRELRYAQEQTANNTGLLFQIALNYGGRAEIVDTVNRIMAILREKEMSDAVIDEAFFGDHLYTANVDDPDLLIRTSGELRVSNFLLWQIAYAEIHVTKVLWPDFRKQHLFEAIIDFQSRERRYGGVEPSDNEMFVEQEQTADSRQQTADRGRSTK